jgi:hypothetical protein
MSVFFLGEKHDHTGENNRVLCHFEGYIPLSHEHCIRLFKTGSVTLRGFVTSCGGSRYVLPHSAEDIRASIDDLLVLEEDLRSFEAAQSTIIESLSQGGIEVLDDSFRILKIDGKIHRFGEMQAAILGKLQQAAIEGEPWKNGKRLLAEVGSESFTLGNVFKHKPVWKQLVNSDGRGSYRLADKVFAAASNEAE